MLNIKIQFLRAGISQRYVADTCGISRGAMAQLLNHGQWPTKAEQRARIKTRLLKLCAEHEIPSNDSLWEHASEKDEPLCSNTAALKAGPRSAIFKDNSSENQPTSPEGEIMLLRRQTMTPAAKKAFGLFASPFGDLGSSDDMFQGQDIRYVCEHMMHTAKNGGFLAIVGESGAGKTTLRKYLEEKIDKEGLPVLLVQPYVIAAEDKAQGNRTTMRAGHIAEAILGEVAPHKATVSSPQARFKALHEALKESHEAGNRHCVVIEEAHAMPINTLKHLKRILELEVGFTKLVSIVLLGQPELMSKLNQRSAAVREVVQRCEIARLEPLAVSDVAAFIAHRLGRANVDIHSVINEAGITALVERLTDSSDRTHLYPLAVGNFLVAAMNLAADIGCDVVDAEVIQGVSGNG